MTKNSKSMTNLLTLLIIYLFYFLYLQSFYTMADIQFPEDYDKDLRPSFIEGVTDKVMFGLHIYQIGPLAESDMSMTADIYLRAFWKDLRLLPVAHALLNRTNSSKVKQPPSAVNLKGAYAKAIWRPNIYFVDSMVESTPAEISQSAITLITKDGLLMASDRVVLKTRCALDLRQFPLDRQSCPICFSSYEYKDSEQLIAWEEGRVDIDKRLNSTATFDIVPILTQETITQQWGDDTFYTKLCVNVKFKRKFKIYIVTMFLPSISLVGLSWVSFWIDKKAVPARAGLTITTILAQITLITGTANKFPGVADLKIGDIYMIVNFFFVFGSLIEFAIVNNASKEVSPKISPEHEPDNQTISKTAETRHLLNKFELSSVDITSSVPAVRDDEVSRNGKNSDVETKRRATKSQIREREIGFLTRIQRNTDIDNISKVLFPTSFLIWHVIFVMMGYMTLEE